MITYVYLNYWNRSSKKQEINFIQYITTILMSYFKLYPVQLTVCNVLKTRMGFGCNVPNSKFLLLFHIHCTPSCARKTNSQRYVTLQTIENYVRNSYVAYKKCYCKGEGTNDRCHKYLQTHSLHINNPLYEDTWST